MLNEITKPMSFPFAPSGHHSVVGNAASLKIDPWQECDKMLTREGLGLHTLPLCSLTDLVCWTYFLENKSLLYFPGFPKSSWNDKSFSLAVLNFGKWGFHCCAWETNSCSGLHLKGEKHREPRAESEHPECWRHTTRTCCCWVPQAKRN